MTSSYTDASTYCDDQNRYRFEAGSMVNGVKVGGRFVAELDAMSFMASSLVSFRVERPLDRAAQLARKAVRRRRNMRQINAGAPKDWDGASINRLYVA
jgi:hypothetical protein